MENNNNAIKWVVIVILVVLVVWGGYMLFASNKSSSTPASSEPITVGVLGPLTGDAASYGEPRQNMLVLAAEEINAAGGVDGAPVKLIFEDSKCNGKDASSAAQKLINVDKVKVIIGGFCSSESLAAIPLAEEAKIVMLSDGASSPDLTGKSRFFFRNYPSDATQGRVLAEAAYNAKKWRTVVMIQEQTDYALGVYKSFSANFESLGGKKVVKEEFPTQTTDFRSILAKLKALKPDALFISTQTPAAAERILKQLKDLNWKPSLLVNDALAGDPKTVENNKDVLEGALAAEFGIDPQNPKFQHAMEAYKTKYGAEPPFQSYAQTTYDALFIVKDGILAVGLNGEKLADWSRTIKDWEGASGKTTIGDNGDRVGGHMLKVVKNGKVEVAQ